jgi:hypothetical protein
MKLVGMETGHTLMASSLALRTAPQAHFDNIDRTKKNMSSRAHKNDPTAAALADDSLEWDVSGLTLHALHGLAQSVNPADQDITPVQAWFELAAAYPMDLLLREDVLDGLKRGFEGVVKCPHYGATMERTAYDSVVMRVLGTAPVMEGFDGVGGGGGDDGWGGGQGFGGQQQQQVHQYGV